MNQTLKNLKALYFQEEKEKKENVPELVNDNHSFSTEEAEERDNELSVSLEEETNLHGLQIPSTGSIPEQIH